MIAPRNALSRIAAAGLTIAGLWSAPFTALPAQRAATDDAALRRARALLREVGLVDTHNDLPWVLRLDPTHPMDLTARDLRARHYRAGGMSNGEIATRLGITEKGVERLFHRMDAPPVKGSAAQLSLFSED